MYSKICTPEYIFIIILNPFDPNATISNRDKVDTDVVCTLLETLRTHLKIHLLFHASASTLIRIKYAAHFQIVTLHICTFCVVWTCRVRVIALKILLCPNFQSD